MKIKYTTDKSTQILISLLKAHKIRKVVASPGTTNAMFVASIQNDKDFEVYSSVDERSAAYIACGLAQESGEPVVITCTEATASRNYFPGLTEAYYRKLPILAITGFHKLKNIGQLYTQAIDRSQPPKDTIKYSTNIEQCNNAEDEWYVNFEINKAILELTRDGGGPVHINLQVGKRWDFFEEELPNVRVIHRISYNDEFPQIPEGKIAIVIGTHKRFNANETKAIDAFCENHNAVVFADIISGYYGNFRVNASILGNVSDIKNVDLLIHIGEIGWSSAKSKQTWRISEDGVLRDTYHNLTYFFDMDIITFFDKYTGTKKVTTYYDKCILEINKTSNKIPELPFSNAWIAQKTIPLLPHNCKLHLGILNSFRVWNTFSFNIDKSIETYCNFGGFGIDGGISTLVGASLASPKHIHIGIFGDLAFFYDMNVIGNRHIGNNVRILLINNGKGNEFRNCIHPAYKLGEEGEPYVAAAGHFGSKSKNLVRHYSSDLGYTYMTANNKEDFMYCITKFLTNEEQDKPVIFEVFTETEQESQSLNLLNNITSDSANITSSRIKNSIRNIIGDKGIANIKKIIK